MISSIFRCFRPSYPAPETTLSSPVNLSHNVHINPDFPVIIYESNPESETCAICLEELECGDEIRVLRRCMHVFHKDCIDEWLPNRSMMCPVCRTRAVDREIEVNIRRAYCTTLDVGNFNTQFHIALYL
ncbi:RING-type domain-containing protein [Heracleum sosnowskyi]|uniref:RING-type domain-containing protein n=1 Tax=Heracleum sosnowskyi TaxID=360622 RepID=A0AAD8M7G6_9APIA|nr:RING-type domain-containing protein [Heracleum sosnowskyi]